MAVFGEIIRKMFKECMQSNKAARQSGVEKEFYIMELEIVLPPMLPY